ncbi:hypothetical protein WJX72_011760 [[Myrmecia] bisecta]|uniref:UBL3-like ubiquitin domain-containing protein n=1 Tax=[Myrmecia] bisecta TaxID=41462 RepID=A0AAW1Q4X6_9CHLO
MSQTAILIRFRHTQGDVGPFSFPASATVHGLKERLLAEWPAEGPLSSERPNAAADLKLILGGKFLDVNTVLADLRAAMGDPQADTVVTIHIVVRPQTAAKATVKSEEASKQACCSIC